MEDSNKQSHDTFTSQNQATQSGTHQEEEAYKVLFTRLNADFQNFKRRVEKEKSEWMLIAETHIIEKFVGIFDELDRVITLAQEQSALNNKSWIDGLVLLQKQWHKTLTELNIEEVTTTGMFDPNQHEALMQVDTSDKASGSIVAVFHKGYLYKGKVIRHAKVSVAK